MKGARILAALISSTWLALGCEADHAELELFEPSAAADSGSAGGASGGARCQTDEDCPDSEQRICDPTTRSCVGCLADSDCSQGEQPRCLMPDRICGECASDADCPNDEPGCLLSEHRCRQCSNDTHCAAGQICAADGSCR